MHCRHRWHQKKRKARRALRLHNWLTMAQTSHEPAAPLPPCLSNEGVHQNEYINT